MGRSIAQISVGGYKVKMFDAQEGAAAKAEEFIHRMVNRAAEKGLITEAEAATGRLAIVNNLSEMGDCSLVIEAIVEPWISAVFSELEGIVAEDAILASNTSSLSVTHCGRLRKTGTGRGLPLFQPCSAAESCRGRRRADDGGGRQAGCHCAEMRHGVDAGHARLSGQSCGARALPPKVYVS